MPQASKTFRIFVSSTFSDLKDERNALQKFVFPRLRELCTQHGCRFQAIDLRWGVRDEAGLDQQTMKICLDEITRSQRASPRPNFIVLLGDRYGWRPLPAEIPAAEFEQLLARVTHDEQEVLLWSDAQPDRQKGWYRRDDNAVPSVYCLQPRPPHSEFADYDAWEKRVERPLRRALLAGTAGMNLSQAQRLKYEASATTQEIWAGALDVPDAPEHVFCFFRSIPNLPHDESAKDFVDLDENRNLDTSASSLLNQLKRELENRLPDNVDYYEAAWIAGGPSTAHIGELPDDLEACLKLIEEPDPPKTLCVDVWKRLARVIQSEIDNLERIEPLDKEIADNDAFGADRAQCFIGRSSILHTIEEYLRGSDRHPLAVWGESGSGKSALVARAIADSKDRIPGCNIVSRFIGATPGSTDGRTLVDSLCRQVSRLYEESSKDFPTDYADLVKEFAEQLSRATAEAPLIIFLDALDQLSDGDHARNLTWLPGRLPEHVHIVVSTVSGECKTALERKLPSTNLVELTSMPSDEATQLLDVWLTEAGRTLKPAQRRLVHSTFDDSTGEGLNGIGVGGIPLYLRLAFEEARRWRSYTTAVDLDSSISGIIRQLFNRLSLNSNHGEVVVSRSLGYLSAAKNGLSEDELLDLLSRDEAVLADFSVRSKHTPPEERLPPVVWSRLYFDLEPYLVERSADSTTLLSFFHRQVGEAAAREFLGSAEGVARHRDLATYFKSLPLWVGKQARPNLRKTSELPFHEALGEMWDELENTLCDLTFIDAKCAAGLVCELEKDYSRALDNLPEASEVRRSSREEARRNREEVIARARELSSARSRYFDNPWANPLPGASASEPLTLIPSVRPLSAKQIASEADRINNSPTRSDRISAFGQFVAAESHNLPRFAGRPGFCAQQAYNLMSTGPVAAAAEQILGAGDFRDPVLLLRSSQRPPYNPHPALVRTLVGHRAPVTAFAISANGLHAISGDRDGAIKIWDVETGECLDTPGTPGHSVTGLVMTPDGSFAVSVGEKGTLYGHPEFSVRVWDLKSGVCIRKFSGHRGAVTSIAVTPDGMLSVSAGADNSIRVWDVERDICRQTIWTELSEINSVSITADGRSALLSGTAKEKIHSNQLLDLLSGAALKDLPRHCSGDLLGDGLRGFSQKPACIWDLATGRIIKRLRFLGKYTQVKLTPDGCLAVGLSKRATFDLWDVKERSLIRSFPAGQLVEGFELSADCQIAVSQTGSQLKVWNIHDGHETASSDHKAVRKATMLVDGPGVILARSSGASMTLSRWDWKTGESIGSENAIGSEHYFALTPDGRRIIFTEFGYGGAGHSFRIWDRPSARDIERLAPLMNIVGRVTLAADGRLGVSAGWEGAVGVWDFDRFSCQKLLVPAISPENHSITADGRFVVIWGKSGLSVSETTSEKTRMLAPPSEFAGDALRLSSDGRHVFTLSSRGRLRVWHLGTGVCVTAFSVPDGNWNSFDVRLDGHIALVSYSNIVRLLNLDDGKCLLEFISPSSDSGAVRIVGNSVAMIGLSGNALFYEMKNIPSLPASVAVVKLWRYGAVDWWMKTLFLLHTRLVARLSTILIPAIPVAALFLWASWIRKFAPGSVGIGRALLAMFLTALISFLLYIRLSGRGVRIHRFRPRGRWDPSFTAACPWCGIRFDVPESVLDRVSQLTMRAGLSEESNCLNLPDEAWNDTSLESKCPKCNSPLRFNPFVVDNAEFLERLEHERPDLERELGDPTRWLHTEQDNKELMDRINTNVELGNLAEARRLVESLPETSLDLQLMKTHARRQIDAIEAGAADLSHIEADARVVVQECESLVQQQRFDEARRRAETIPIRQETQKYRLDLLAEINRCALVVEVEEKRNRIVELMSRSELTAEVLDDARQIAESIPDSEELRGFRTQVLEEIGRHAFSLDYENRRNRILDLLGRGELEEAITELERIPDLSQEMTGFKKEYRDKIRVMQLIQTAAGLADGDGSTT